LFWFAPLSSFLYGNNAFVADVTLGAQISLTQGRRISCLLLALSTKTLPTELGVKKKEKEELFL
jgi:hypothetical protein